MPQLIEPIDAIARAKKRDALYIQFHPLDYYDNLSASGNYDYVADVTRKRVLNWLAANEIPWVESAPMAEQHGVLFMGYVGDVYIDVPFDDADPQYCLVRDYLENPDGTMRNVNVRFWALSLTLAMEYAHHDEPGYWDRMFG